MAEINQIVKVSENFISFFGEESYLSGNAHLTLTHRSGDAQLTLRLPLS